MEKEIDISKCRACGKLEVRKHVGYFPNGRDKKYIGLDGKQWVGRKCPNCVRSESKVNIKAKRAEKKKDEEVH